MRNVFGDRSEYGRQPDATSHAEALWFLWTISQIFVSILKYTIYHWYRNPGSVPLYSFKAVLYKTGCCDTAIIGRSAILDFPTRKRLHRDVSIFYWSRVITHVIRIRYRSVLTKLELWNAAKCKNAPAFARVRIEVSERFACWKSMMTPERVSLLKFKSGWWNMVHICCNPEETYELLPRL